MPDSASIGNLEYNHRTLGTVFFVTPEEEWWDEELKVYTRLRNVMLDQLINLAESLLELEMDGVDTAEIGEITLANAHSIVAAADEFKEHARNNWKTLSAGGGT